MKRKTFFWQIFPYFFFIVFLALAITLAITFFQVKQYFFNETVAQLQEKVTFILPQIEAQFENSADLNKLLKIFSRKSQFRLTIIDINGKVTADSEANISEMDNHRARPEIAQAIGGHSAVVRRSSKTLNQEMVYVAYPIIVNNKIVGALRGATFQRQLNIQVSQFIGTLVFGGSLLLFLLIFVSYYLSKKLSYPLEKITQHVSEASEEGLKERLLTAPDDSQEFFQLAQSINMFSDQLKKRYKKIFAQKREREAILSSMKEGLLAVDLKEHIIHCNLSASDMLTLSEKDVGKTLDEVPMDMALKNYFKKNVHRQRHESEEVTLCLNKEEKIFLIQSGPLLKAKMKQYGTVFIIDDITKIHKLESYRHDFVANVSHELKTPMTLISGFVETLLSSEVSPKEQKKFLGIIDKHAKRLSSIIESLLALANIEDKNTKQEVEFEYHDLKEVVTAACDICSEEIEKKNVLLKIEIENKFKLYLNRDLFIQALVNLIENAIKYGGDTPEVLIESRNEKGFVIISVKDNGLGIAKEHLPRLFERFYRVDKGRGRNQGGTGLGLAIVKHVVLAHKGSVEVISDVGQGAEFRIILPQTEFKAP